MVRIEASEHRLLLRLGFITMLLHLPETAEGASGRRGMRRAASAGDITREGMGERRRLRRRWDHGGGLRDLLGGVSDKRRR